MVFLRNLWAFLMGLLAGAMTFVEASAIISWKVDSQNFLLLAKLFDKTGPYFFTFLGALLGLGSLFLLIDLWKETRLVPDPWTQPWATAIPVVAVLGILALLRLQLLPMLALDLERVTTDELDSILQQWVVIYGLATAAGLLGFLFSSRASLRYAQMTGISLFRQR